MELDYPLIRGAQFILHINGAKVTSRNSLDAKYAEEDASDTGGGLRRNAEKVPASDLLKLTCRSGY